VLLHEEPEFGVAEHGRPAELDDQIAGRESKAVAKVPAPAVPRSPGAARLHTAGREGTGSGTMG
jgi:hypothetical protein